MPQRRVLVVDDDPSYCRMARRTMERHRYEAIEAYSARDAIRKTESFKPHLILLDIHLGGDSGITLWETFRSNHTTAHIPVILLTGMDILDDLLDAGSKGLRAGRIHRKTEGSDALLKEVRRALKHGCYGASGRQDVSPPSRNGHHEDRFLSRGCIKVDLQDRRIWIGGREIPELPIRRFDLVCALLRAKGPLKRRHLLRQVWRHRREAPGVVAVTMMRLRKDLAGFPDVRIVCSSKGYKLLQK